MKRVKRVLSGLAITVLLALAVMFPASAEAGVTYYRPVGPGQTVYITCSGWYSVVEGPYTQTTAIYSCRNAPDVYYYTYCTASGVLLYEWWTRPAGDQMAIACR
jgi:hypothetical protein